MKDVIDDLANELYVEIKEAFSEEEINEVVLRRKVKNAIKSVIDVRKYPSNYTEEQIEKDLSKYFSNIQNITLYDYNQVGAEFQNSHSENSVSRSWQDREKLFAGIIPLASI